ncbi:MAG: TolC family protein [Bacteroidota bacterium]
MKNNSFRYFIFVLAFFAYAGNSSAQQNLLTLEEIHAWIFEQHPLAQSARLEMDRAKGVQKEARGAFDPKLFADWEQKAFDRKDYFSVGEGGVKIPTRLGGVEFKASYNEARGTFLNPMENLPMQGQLNLGIKVPLLQGLRIDAARTNLRKAEAEQPRAEAIYRQEVADLLVESSKLYWEWWIAFTQVNQYNAAVELAQVRLEGIKESFIAGASPAIDTLETFLQYQDRINQRNVARLDFQKASWDLANFFGDAETLANRLIQDYMPGSALTDRLPPELENLLAQTQQSHPELINLRQQQVQIQADQRWAQEQMLPKLNVEYNVLGNGVNLVDAEITEGGESGINQLFTQNYKWGLNFEFPLFMRKAKGKLEQTQIKASQLELKTSQKSISLANKVQNITTEMNIINQQIEVLESQVENQQQLLDLEQLKFDIGKSSVFLLNSREQKLVDTQLKLTKELGAYQKAYWKLQWASGVIVP